MDRNHVRQPPLETTNINKRNNREYHQNSILQCNTMKRSYAVACITITITIITITSISNSRLPLGSCCNTTSVWILEAKQSLGVVSQIIKRIFSYWNIRCQWVQYILFVHNNAPHRYHTGIPKWVYLDNLWLQLSANANEKISWSPRNATDHMTSLIMCFVFGCRFTQTLGKDDNNVNFPLWLHTQYLSQIKTETLETLMK